MRKIGLLMVVLFCGCGLSWEKDELSATHVLIDNSGSLAEEVRDRIHRGVLEDVDAWLKGSMPGDRLEIWWFLPSGSNYPVGSHPLIMPELSPPAHIHRREISKAILDEVQKVLSHLPAQVTVTPLLESLYFIASNQHQPYSVTLYSDLAQDSPHWNTMKRRCEEEGLLDLMLEFCPTVLQSPQKIALVSWPGIAREGQNSVHVHVSNRKLWRRFLESWSPSTSLVMHSLP